MKTIGSIVFDKTAIYGIVASGSPEDPSIHKTVYLNRTENLQADWDSIKENFYDTSSIGIVESTPAMTFTKDYFELGSRLEGDEEEEKAKRNGYTFDHLGFSDELGLPKRYYVGVKKDTIREITNVFTASNMRHQLDLVDYWPFGTNGFDAKKKAYRTNIIENDEGITGYVWYKDAILAKATLEQEENPIHFIIRLWSLLPTISSVAKYPINLYIENEHLDSWSTLMANHEVNVITNPVDATQGKNGCWNVAFGMAKRILDNLA